MRVIIAPAKKMNTDLDSLSPKAMPQFLDRTERLIPDYLVPVALLPIGYAADGVEPHPWHFKRFDIDYSVFYNSFDGITEGEAH